MQGHQGKTSVRRFRGEDGGAVSVAPAPVSSTAPVGPINFSAWAVKGIFNRKCVRGVYAFLGGAIEARE